jgi:hypothetical protein
VQGLEGEKGGESSEECEQGAHDRQRGDKIGQEAGNEITG